MNKATKASAKDEERPLRVTRARARALGSLGGIPPYSRPSFKNEQKNALRANSKRTASDENRTSVVAPADPQHKGRAVLTDVTNISINASKFQVCMKGSLYLQMQIRVIRHFIIQVNI